MAAICDNCGGPLLYSPKRGAMFCRKCGSTFKAEEIEDASRELLSEERVRSYSEVYGSEDSLYDCHVYTCNHCGADIILNGTETSTLCIYCGSPNVVFSRIMKQHKPEGIMPFKVTREEAAGIIKEHVKKAKFVPDELKNIKASDIRGIYMPYWVVNADFYGAYQIESTEGSGKSSRTYYYGRAATCKFRAVPFDASTKLNDDLSRALEPYFLEDVKVFDEDYLSGFYSDQSDLTPEKLRTTALRRMENMLAGELMAPIAGHGKRVMSSFPYVDIKDDSVYLLLPAWFFTFVSDGKPYTILVNGQTGKAVGFVPPSKKKYYRTFFTIFFSLCALLLLPLVFSGDVIVRAVMMFLRLVAVYGTFIMAFSLAMMLRKLRSSWLTAASVSTFNYVRKRQE